MFERMTSRADAATLKAAVMKQVDTLESMGFDRGQIGAAMSGIALGLCAVHNGREWTLEAFDKLRALVERGDAPLS